MALYWFLAYTILLPVNTYFWIKGRTVYKNQFNNIKPGDRFVVHRNTYCLSIDRVYVVNSIEEERITFINDKGWIDKIHVNDVHKIME